MSHFFGQILVCAYTIFTMTKLQSLAQFPIDHLSHPVMPTLVFLLCPFAAFGFYNKCRLWGDIDETYLPPRNLHLLFSCVLSILTFILLFLLLQSFSHQCWLMVFHWNLTDSKSPQVSRTRLRILAVRSNSVVWIVSTHPQTSKSSRPFNNPLVIVPKAPITIGTIVTFMFHSFFNSLARSRYLSFFSLSFRFILWFAGTAKSTILQILFFFLFFFFFCWLLWGLVFWPGLGDPFVC